MGKFFDAHKTQAIGAGVGAIMGAGLGALNADDDKQLIIKGLGGAVLGAGVGYGIGHAKSEVTATKNFVTEKATDLHKQVAEAVAKVGYGVEHAKSEAAATKNFVTEKATDLRKQVAEAVAKVGKARSKAAGSAAEVATNINQHL
jgi:hypothetical protein